MTRIEKSIEINATPEKIWPLIQWEKIPEWHTEFKKIEVTSKDKYKVGSTVHEIIEVGGTIREMDAEITEFTENEKVAWRTTGGAFTASGYFALSPTKAGTKVTQMMDYELPYSVFGKLIDKLRVHKAIDESYDVALKKLKDIIEK